MPSPQKAVPLPGPIEAGTGTRQLNLKQAARLLGVHYMTAYRYVRQGRLPAVQAGKTWLVSEADIAQFVSQPTGAAAPGRPHVDWARRLTSCLLSGDETSAWRVVQAALASGRTPQFCYADMLSTALASVGSGWEAGEVSVADQHIATAVAARVAARLGALARRPGRSRGTVVFGAPLGERHALPVAIVSDLVRLAGFSVLELGADVPAEAFALAARRAPHLVAVGVGVTRAQMLDEAQLVVDAVRAVNQDVPIIIGGQAAISASGSTLIGVTAWAADGTEAVALVEGFVQRRQDAGLAVSHARRPPSALSTQSKLV